MIAKMAFSVRNVGLAHRARDIYIVRSGAPIWNFLRRTLTRGSKGRGLRKIFRPNARTSAQRSYARSRNAAIRPPRSMETKMRNKVLTVLGVLLIAALTIPMATAAARHARKAARAHVPVTQQLRERQRLSTPAASHNRSCDIIWCYED